MVFSVVGILCLLAFALFCFIRHNRQVSKRSLMLKKGVRVRKK